MSQEKVAIHWFRRDLRLKDNRALYEATKNSCKVVGVFIFDPEILLKLKDKKDKRVSFIWDALLSLREELEAAGGSLMIYHGKVKDVYKQLLENNDISGVYTNEDYEPYAIARDKSVETLCAKYAVDFHSYKDQVVFRGDEVLKKDGTAYKVYSPYKKAWLKTIQKEDLNEYRPDKKSYAEQKLSGPDQVTSLESMKFEYEPCAFVASCKEAEKRFKSFLKIIAGYHDARDDFSSEKTSGLSMYIRFGLLPIRHLYREAFKYKAEEGAKAWITELIWREFYQMILVNFPYVEKSAFKPQYDDLVWEGDKKHFEAWKKGETGFPIIDAAMRHFAKTGQMHNRLRMVVASFFVKDLLLDWRLGEAYFAEKLLDFDLSANNGGWQWSASTGCDAQPYFRVFNPTSQSKRFDPEGKFIRRVIPELDKYSKKYIHEPHLAPPMEQKLAECEIGKDYPKPIVEHSEMRLRAIAMFKA